jgi:hypothetical protein
MPDAEWKSSLQAIGGELERAEYHLLRFRSVVETLRRRRDVAGGPVFGDTAPARAVYCEAVGFLSALRTALDIVIYVAARRAGVTAEKAEKWEASKAINPGPGTPSPKYETEDIKALRPYKPWFETLNLYRNSMIHRGWHEQSFGYFSKGDTAPEAGDPVNNVMLVPDLRSLAEGQRPDKWTYNDRTWLDDLTTDLATSGEAAFRSVLSVWSIPDYPPGTLPRENQPNALLTLPLLRAIEGQAPPALHVFLCKRAARLFFDHTRARGLVLEHCSFRAMRRMKLRNYGTGYLAVYDANTLGDKAEMHLLDVDRLGRLTLVQKHEFAPHEENGPAKETLWFQLQGEDPGTVYVLDHDDSRAPSTSPSEPC